MATNLGKVGMVMKGTWNNSATYEVLDAVTYNGSLYIAKQNVPANTTPTNTTYWQLATDLTAKTDKVASATNNGLAGLNSSGNLIDTGILMTTIKRESVVFDNNFSDNNVLKIASSSGTNFWMGLIKGTDAQLYAAFLVMGYYGGATRNTILVLDKGSMVDTIAIESSANTDYTVVVRFTGTFTNKSLYVVAVPFTNKTFTITKE